MLSIKAVKGMVKATGSAAAEIILTAAESTLAELENWDGRTEPPAPVNPFDMRTQAAQHRAHQAGVMGAQAIAIENLIKERANAS